MFGKKKVYYKILDKDMKSPYQNFQYELGKKYKIASSDVIPYIEGFNACKDLYDVVLYSGDQPLNEHRFFECKLGRKIKPYSNGYAVCSNSITLTKEIPFEDVDKSIKDNIDILLHDNNLYTKTKLVVNEYGLEILAKDRDLSISLLAQVLLDKCTQTSN